MSVIETLRGYVNTWDCDENDHLNVQHYVRFFEDASDHFLARLGLATDAGWPVVRHVRYHAELRANAGVRVDSMVVGSGRQAAHLLYETPGDRLSATCLETFRAPLHVTATPGRVADVPDEARPRSIDAAPGSEGGAPPGAVPVLAGRIRSPDCGPDGTAFDSAVIGLNSDSAAHFWGAVGIDRPWLEARGLGRVAVEMKLTRCAALKLGDLVHVVSRPRAVARSTVTFENRFVRTLTGEVAAIVEVTGLTMNLATRRAEPLPEDLRAWIAARIAPAGAAPQMRSSS